MNNALLTLRNVRKSFDQQVVLDGIDFSLQTGQVIGLLGRNGAGKTTMLECALGLREINGGEIEICGDAPDALSEATRARIGYVPQQTDLFEWLTAAQMLAYFKAFYPRWNDAKVTQLLERWAIAPNRIIKKLSGGEKQRLAIIRALAHEPDVLILDEPVAALDPAGRRDFLRELVALTGEQETSIIFSTHILSDLERVALDVAFMKAGKIVMQRPLDTLSEQARRLTGSSQLLGEFKPTHEIARRTTVDSSGNLTTEIVALVDDDQEGDFAALVGQGAVMRQLSLEDLFVEVS